MKLLTEILIISLIVFVLSATLILLRKSAIPEIKYVPVPLISAPRNNI